MKTTIEWLEHMLSIILNEEEFKKITYTIQQAKEMEKQQINSNKCYHPLTERKHTSDTHFECTICGYNNY